MHHQATSGHSLDINLPELRSYRWTVVITDSEPLIRSKFSGYWTYFRVCICYFSYWTNNINKHNNIPDIIGPLGDNSLLSKIRIADLFPIWGKALHWNRKQKPYICKSTMILKREIWYSQRRIYRTIASWYHLVIVTMVFPIAQVPKSTRDKWRAWGDCRFLSS